MGDYSTVNLTIYLKFFFPLPFLAITNNSIVSIYVHVSLHQSNNLYGIFLEVQLLVRTIYGFSTLSAIIKLVSNLHTMSHVLESLLPYILTSIRYYHTLKVLFVQ